MLPDSTLPGDRCQFRHIDTPPVSGRVRSAQLSEANFLEVYRVLTPGGLFILIDFHSRTNQVFLPRLAAVNSQQSIAINQIL